MIISHTHRYVFIELPRTGSSTINQELRRNYGGEWLLGKHSTYQDFLRVATPDERTYFTFSGIRNPLDVAVSRYTQVLTDARERFSDQGKRARRSSLPERIENRVYDWVHQHKADFAAFLLHWYWLPYDTWSSMDHRKLSFVIRFESLDADFAEALKRIGLAQVRPLPARNVTPGRSRELDDYYTSRVRRRATWVFGPYMEEWGYAFPASWGAVRVPGWARTELRVLRLFRSAYWRFLRHAPSVTPRGQSSLRQATGMPFDDEEPLGSDA